MAPNVVFLQFLPFNWLTKADNLNILKFKHFMFAKGRLVSQTTI